MSWKLSRTVLRGAVGGNADRLLDKKLATTSVDSSEKPETKKAAVAKQPFVFTLGSGEPFAFAGLWDSWKDPVAGALESFTIITTTPNELTASVHNRMPVMLQPQDYDLWLQHLPAEKNTLPVPQLELIALLRPYPADKMEAREAHMDVGNVRNNHPGLMNSAQAGDSVLKHSPQ